MVQEFTEITRTTPSGWVVFCDDIREEVAGKISLMGVYNGGMLINAPFPVALPKLCCSVTFIEGRGENDQPVAICVQGPDGEELGRVDVQDLDELRAQAHLQPPEHKLIMTMQITLTPITFKQPGCIKVLAVSGDKAFRLGALDVNTSAE